MHPTHPAAPLLRPSPQLRLWRLLLTLGTPLSSAGEDLIHRLCAAGCVPPLQQPSRPLTPATIRVLRCRWSDHDERYEDFDGDSSDGFSEAVSQPKAGRRRLGTTSKRHQQVPCWGKKAVLQPSPPTDSRMLPYRTILRMEISWCLGRLNHMLGRAEGLCVAGCRLSGWRA